jgi:hypothetical protein
MRFFIWPPSFLGNTSSDLCRRSHRNSNPRIRPETGTTRCLRPLPRTRRVAWSASKSVLRSARHSASRKPVSSIIWACVWVLRSANAVGWNASSSVICSGVRTSGSLRSCRKGSIRNRSAAWPSLKAQFRNALMHLAWVLIETGFSPDSARPTIAARSWALVRLERFCSSST